MGKRKSFKIQPKATHQKKAAVRVRKTSIPLVIASLAVTFSAFLFSQLFLFNRLATEGDTLKSLEQQKNELAQKKINLEQNIVELTSLSRIDKQAREKLGMTSVNGNVQYITPEKVASLF